MNVNIDPCLFLYSQSDSLPIECDLKSNPQDFQVRELSAESGVEVSMTDKAQKVSPSDLEFEAYFDAMEERLVKAEVEKRKKWGLSSVVSDDPLSF